MKKIVFAFSILVLSIGANAQAVSVADPDNMDPTAEIKIIVDLTQTDNEFGIVETAAGGEDMYIWTWKPAEHPPGHPLANGIGATAWKNSNDTLKMTFESPGIYSFTMVPTEFYEVTAKDVYDNDIHFLVKPKDGGGYGDPDHKTEDLVLEFELPAGPSKIAYAFPNAYGAELDSVKVANDDIFSLVYDIDAETKESMKTSSEFYIYPIVTGTDSVQYKLASNAKKVTDFPVLQLQNNGDGTYQWSKFVSDLPSVFNLPTGVQVAYFDVIIVKPNLVNSADASDEKIEVNLVICE